MYWFVLPHLIGISTTCLLSLTHTLCAAVSGGTGRHSLLSFQSNESQPNSRRMSQWAGTVHAGLSYGANQVSHVQGGR